jgi:hypothetical protein
MYMHTYKTHIHVGPFSLYILPQYNRNQKSTYTHKHTTGFGEEARPGEEIEKMRERLSMYTFRSSDAAFMVLNVLAKAHPKTQERVLSVLMMTIELNPGNGEVLSSMEGITVLLGIINRCSAPLKALYMHLLSTIGQYNVTPEETRLLFELAMPQAEASLGSVAHARSPGVAQDEGQDTLRLQIMSVIGEISKRVTPPAFFHFDGRPGWVKFGLEKFPVAKVCAAYIRVYAVCWCVCVCVCVFV